MKSQIETINKKIITKEQELNGFYKYLEKLYKNEKITEQKYMDMLLLNSYEKNKFYNGIFADLNTNEKEFNVNFSKNYLLYNGLLNMFKMENGYIEKRSVIEDFDIEYEEFDKEYNDLLNKNHIQMDTHNETNIDIDIALFKEKQEIENKNIKNRELILKTKGELLIKHNDTKNVYTLYGEKNIKVYKIIEKEVDKKKVLSFNSLYFSTILGFNELNEENTKDYQEYIKELHKSLDMIQRFSDLKFSYNITTKERYIKDRKIYINI
jgi:hypothetical protein